MRKVELPDGRVRLECERRADCGFEAIELEGDTKALLEFAEVFAAAHLFDHMEGDISAFRLRSSLMAPGGAHSPSAPRLPLILPPGIKHRPATH